MKPPFLLVEDDENDVLFLKNAWKKVNVEYPLQVVMDGQAAINYLSGSGGYADRSVHPVPCLVLLDLNLPRKTGLEVLGWIRAQEPYRLLLVVVLTSSSAERDAEQAYLLGANSYVIKPSNPDRLREFVSTLQLYWTGWNYSPTGCGEKDQFLL